MTDIENVTYAIERCTCHVPDACRDCPYDAGHPYNECVEMLLKNALKLLKESETAKLPVRPVYYADSPYLYEAFHCGKCGNRINYHSPYCSNCGKAVKWDD